MLIASKFIFISALFVCILGCSTPDKIREEIEPVTDPLSSTTEEIFKVREIKNKEGKTRAVISPADKKQLKIPL